MKLIAMNPESGEAVLTWSIGELHEASVIVETLTEHEIWPDACDAFVFDENGVMYTIDEDTREWQVAI